jgi:hypothetical protein
VGRLSEEGWSFALDTHGPHGHHCGFDADGGRHPVIYNHRSYYMPLEIADEEAFRIEKITPIDRHWNDNKGDTVTLMMNPSEVDGDSVRPIEERIANSHTGIIVWVELHCRLSRMPYSMVNSVDLGARCCLRNLERNPAIVRRAGARQQPVVMFSLTLGRVDWIMIRLYLTAD